MKPIMITLLYLTFGGDIKLDTFEITKWQKSKIYCTELCKPKWQKPSTGNPVGRPKSKK